MELEQELIARARGIHEQVITLDTHADINTRNFTQENNYTMDLETQVTLPKMEAGGLDVAWFIVYTGQAELDDAGYAAAYANAIDKFDAIHRLAEEIAPDQIEIAYTSDDVRRINSSGKKVAMIGIENAYPIGLDMSNIEDFHDRGGRYMSLAHNGHSQFADSNTGERDDVWLHNGLSPMGRDAILEMNKWGIMVDISHPSKDAIMEMLDLTQAPLIASHSSARAMSEHSRNLDDETLLRIKENGGVVQTVAFKSYLNAEKNTRNAEAISRLNASIAADLGYEILSFAERNSLNSADRAAYDVQLSEIGRLAAPRIADEVNAVAPPVDVSDFVDHIDYLVEFIGLEHVGISSDFDGGGGVEGWNNAAETFNVTFELVKRGYSEEEIGLLWSGNLLRVLDEVQRIAAELQAQ
ncbi:MAG: membrane dipeptidase [Gammaproteobacteria bacterium]|nr:membrane dipeptidase [Gammaproteobacteria bacterium]MDP7456228.1 membrane dipeptidase [Gammaproteobacteria bacterium]HJO10778.1 membrane dipeptidase [Gammaproteobacteria bacterium]